MRDLGGPHRRLVALLGSALLLGGCASTSVVGAAPTPTASITGTIVGTPEEFAAAVIVATNEARVDNGLPPFTESPCAEEHALSRATELLLAEEFAHAPLETVILACAPTGLAAENLARGSATPEQVVEAWLASPGHRENILNPALTEVGVACVLLEVDGVLCSQIFLAPSQ